ncbi:hypothetical protein NC651_029178 [Populus alba x Populus x berolinensis]|nr:hypothetical protein NC651_029178 [Populus alba x Populus x berolinensis]
MRSTLWNDQNMFWTTLKIRIYPKTLLFSDERGSGTNCWWEKPLVVALKHSEGIKYEVLLQKKQKLNNNNKALQYTPPLSLYLLFFSSLHTYNNLSLDTYLYTKSVGSKFNRHGVKAVGG